MLAYSGQRSSSNPKMHLWAYWFPLGLLRQHHRLSSPLVSDHLPSFLDLSHSSLLNKSRPDKYLVFHARKTPVYFIKSCASKRGTDLRVRPEIPVHCLRIPLRCSTHLGRKVLGNEHQVTFHHHKLTGQLQLNCWRRNGIVTERGCSKLTMQYQLWPHNEALLKLLQEGCFRCHKCKENSELPQQKQCGKGA